MIRPSLVEGGVKTMQINTTLNLLRLVEVDVYLFYIYVSEIFLDFSIYGIFEIKLRNGKNKVGIIFM